MEMTLRWYGSKHDSVTLKQIRQIPGVKGVITTLYDTMPGEVWEEADIKAMIDEVEAAGLKVAGIESVNIHDAIKIGSPDREQYIDNYITMLERLGKAGIHMVCYNFMPVFDWTRTELARVRPDGSTVLAYTQEAVDKISILEDEYYQTTPYYEEYVKALGLSEEEQKKKLDEYYSKQEDIETQDT